MTVLRLDNVLLVVEDLDRAVAFFVELGMAVQGIRGPEGILLGLAQELG